jgi:predicted nucleic acid-binding protein
LARFILLDTTPLGLASQRRGIPEVDNCHAWLTALGQAGAQIVVPEIADYEIRRELERLGHKPGLRRLDALAQSYLYAEITTPVMRKAAESWGDVRRRGLPTAGDQSLDADAILAAQAALIIGPSDTATVATANASHLTRFPGIHAQDWTTIT